MKKEFTLWIYVLCYNEIDIMPFVFKYWREYADKVIVFDNGSNDGSLEELSKYDWIEVRHFESDGLNDEINRLIKNFCWLEAKNKGIDFVQVSDFDEVLYADNIIDELNNFKHSTDTIWNSKCYEIYTKAFPSDDKIFCHQSSDAVSVYSLRMSKKILFKPDYINEMNYDAGAHECKPNGVVSYYNNDNLMFYHLKYLGIDYILKKFHSGRERLSQLNKIMRWGYLYSLPDNQIIDIFTEAYNKGLATKTQKQTLYKSQNGQLGNIMFCIACGKYYAEHNNMDFIFHITDANIYERYKEELFKDIQTIDSVDKSDKVSVDEINSTIYTPFDNKHNYDIYVDGYRQSPLYFNNDKEWCKQLFNPSDNIMSAILNKFKNFNLSDWTSVHIRRTDYLWSPHIFPLLTIDDYLNMMRKSGNRRFIIFSDDTQWCRELLKNNNEFDFIIYADNYVNLSSVRDDIVDMYSMTLCKDNIISNSTFSWWSAWLNVHKNRRVFYKSPWFVPSFSITGDIYPENDNWIDCSK